MVAGLRGIDVEQWVREARLSGGDGHHARHFLVLIATLALASAFGLTLVACPFGLTLVADPLLANHIE